MLNLSRVRARRLAAIGFALTTAVGVLILPSTPSGANPIYSPTPDAGTVPIDYTVNTIQHLTVNAAEATTWPPVIGQTDYVRWDFNLQEDITAGKVVVNFKGPDNVPISFSYPVCGTPANSRSAVIPASGPNVWAGPFVWPVGTPASTDPAVSCPIMAGDYNTGLVPFTIPDTVQPGTYAGTVQVADQSGGVIFKTSWQMVLTKPAPTTLTLSASPNPATFGSPVTFTGTLSGGLASPNEPLGSISLGAYTDPSCHNLAFTLGVDNNVNAGNGTYTIGTTTPATPGTYYGSAFFADSDGFNASASSGSCQPILVVNSAPTSTVVTASPNPATPGQGVTYTATVSPPPSSGTATFADNGSTIAGCSAVPVSSGVAQCHVHYATAGNHTILATYNPGVGFLGSTSNPLGETVTVCRAQFWGCNLSSADLVGANLAGFNFARASFASANLSGANLQGANLAFANLSGANLQGSNLSSANLAFANLSGANLQGANLNGLNLNDANLTNANLKGATTTGGAFNSIKWSNTTCPDGTNSNSHGATCVGHL